ncbi:hypothetical protein Scep_001485 [Stephania cephalantha]|uniref:O-fucosyltransferase family protein n=1 Tax=Stephania cephalantha TaxID=152367 RepID=A0AAP0LBU8_9MAGN
MAGLKVASKFGAATICDVVAVARLMNATLVIPELQSTTSSKGIRLDQFIAALAKDVIVVKTLPKNLKWARRKKEIPSFRTVRTASPNYYRHHVLPVLKRHGVVELVISDGGCLQLREKCSKGKVHSRWLVIETIKKSINTDWTQKAMRKTKDFV